MVKVASAMALAAVQRLQRLGYGDEAQRWRTGKDAWGRAETFGPPWVEGRERMLLAIDPPMIWRTPMQQSILLGCKLIPPTSIFQSGVFRWVVQAGVGNASQTYKFDATALQQVTLPGESVRVSLVAEAWDATAFDMGYTSAQVAAMLADGTNSTGSARYTQPVAAAPGATQTDVPVPVGASGFRVHGNSPAASPGYPFGTNKSYGFRQAGGNFEDGYSGDELLPLRASDAFIPIAGTADLLRISHPAGDYNGLIVWQLEL